MVQTSATDWLQIIRGEFEEMPGLRLTGPQAQRLWGLDASTCDALLTALVAANVLQRTTAGTYALVDAEL